MNPFKYGGVVSGKYFYNREEEIRNIKEDLSNGINLLIYAPRRYGKTSLIQKIITELENEGINTIYLDFFNVTDLNRFLEIYSIKILNKQKFSVENTIRKFREFVKGILPSVTIDESGKPQFSVNFIKPVMEKRSFEEVVNLPEKISGSKKWIVILDEFQEINRLNGENFEKQLRSVIQFHKNVSYVFMGSKTHIILNMFRDKKKAFYNFAKTVKLDTIKKEETIKYLKSRFNQSGIKVNIEAIEEIIKISDNIPYYIQFIASELWQKKIKEKNEIKITDIEKVTEKLISAETDYYLEIYGNLSGYQKRVLNALCISGENIYSKQYMEKNRLSTSSSTQRAVNKLINSGIIEKKEENYVFSDPFFKKFVKLRIKA